MKKKRLNAPEVLRLGEINGGTVLASALKCRQCGKIRPPWMEYCPCVGDPPRSEWATPTKDIRGFVQKHAKGMTHEWKETRIKEAREMKKAMEKEGWGSKYDMGCLDEMIRQLKN